MMAVPHFACRKVTDEMSDHDEEEFLDEDAVDEMVMAAAQQKQQQPPPEFVSTPITNHFDAVVECLDFLRCIEDDEQVEKQEVVDALRSRLHNMLSKVLLNNTITSMSMLGWRLE